MTRPDDRGLSGILLPVTGLNIGYARVSTDHQDLTAQRDGLAALGVAADRIYVDHGLTGANRDRRGLHQALAAYRDGATSVRAAAAAAAVILQPVHEAQAIVAAATVDHSWLVRRAVEGR